MTLSRQFSRVGQSKATRKLIIGNVQPQQRAINPAKGMAYRRAVGKSWRSAVPRAKGTT